MIVIVDIKRLYCDANGLFELGKSRTGFRIPCDWCARAYVEDGRERLRNRCIMVYETPEKFPSPKKERKVFLVSGNGMARH